MFRWIKRIIKKMFYKPSEPIPPQTGDFLECPDKYIEHYTRLATTVEVTGDVDYVVDGIRKNMERYKKASSMVNVPWYVIAAIHNMECGQNFSKNMMNGQRLDRVTTWVPKGYGPWPSWEHSCIDAFKIKKLPNVWSVVNTLYFLESYNGTGYLRFHKDVNSPYLWSKTNHYTKGKYVSDGKWSSTAVSKQVGCMAIFKKLGVM